MSTTPNLLFGDDLPKQNYDAKGMSRIGKTVTGLSSKQYDHNRGFWRDSSWSKGGLGKHHKGGQKQPFLGKGHHSTRKKKPYHERNDRQEIASLEKIKLAVSNFPPFIESIKDTPNQSLQNLCGPMHSAFLSSVEEKNF